MEREIDPKLQEPLDDEERELMDPDTWDWDAAQVQAPNANTGAVLAIRRIRDELTRINRAARAEGSTLTEVVKQSALLRAAPNRD